LNRFFQHIPLGDGRFISLCSTHIACVGNQKTKTLFIYKSLEPNPIPIEYVTRAGCIWKKGERYHIDCQYELPLWWVPNLAEQIQIAPHQSSQGAVTWSFAPPNYAKDSSALVCLEVIPDPDTQAWAVEDTPPDGWVATNINEGGQWDAVNKKVNWGPYMDANSRNFYYDIIPITGAIGGQTFSAIASFDGSNQPITRRITDMVGDFNIDGKVNIVDLSILCHYWLQNQTSLDIAPPPIGDGIINFLDYVEFTKHWLDGVH